MSATLSHVRQAIERSPVVWFLTALFTAFGAGASAVVGLQHYSGMTLITKGEYRDLVSRLESDARQPCYRQ